MMKRVLILLPLLLVSLILKAQSDVYWRLYPKVGLNLSKFPNDHFYVFYVGGVMTDYELKSRYKQGLTAGVELSFEKGAGSATLGLMYANRGTKYGDYTYEDASEQEKVSGIQYTLHYLELPLMGGIEVARGLKLKAGIQPGFLLKANFMYSSIVSEKQENGVMTVVEVNDSNTDVGDTFRKVALAIPVGLSYEFSNVVIDARYVIGLNDSSEYIKGRHSGFTFTVGYGFDL